MAAARTADCSAGWGWTRSLFFQCRAKGHGIAALQRDPHPRIYAVLLV